MSPSEYEKYAVRWPRGEAAEAPGGIPAAAAVSATLLSEAQVPGCGHHISLTWIRETPAAEAPGTQWMLDRDQLFLFVGMDVARPQSLGADVEVVLGGQAIVFNTTTSVYIPAGTPYRGPVWKELRRPHVQLSFAFGSGEPPRPVGAERAVPGTAPGDAATAGPAEEGAEPGAFDYEQYVVRSPMREAGPEFVDGRQNPTMTYFSRTQIGVVDNYLEFGWIWDVPHPYIPKMRHDGYDEIVFHIGSDPDHPEDLGGVLQFGLGSDLVEFDTTHCAYVPRHLDHGPLIWKEVRRPLIEMALMLGAGTYDEGWQNSFFDLPEGQTRHARTDPQEG